MQDICLHWHFPFTHWQVILCYTASSWSHCKRTCKPSPRAALSKAQMAEKCSLSCYISAGVRCLTTCYASARPSLLPLFLSSRQLFGKLFLLASKTAFLFSYSESQAEISMKRSYLFICSTSFCSHVLQPPVPILYYYSSLILYGYSWQITKYAVLRKNIP